MAKERRLFERFRARFPARFKGVNDEFGMNVYLRDASASGGKLSTKEYIRLGDAVTLEVSLPDANYPMELTGKVVWVKSQKYEIWDVGFRFSKIDLIHMSRLYQLAPPSYLPN